MSMMSPARYAAVIWPPLIVPAGKDFAPLKIYIDPHRPKSWGHFEGARAAVLECRPMLLMATDQYALALASKVKLPPGWEIERLGGAVVRGVGVAA